MMFEYHEYINTYCKFSKKQHVQKNGILICTCFVVSPLLLISAKHLIRRSLALAENSIIIYWKMK